MRDLGTKGLKSDAVGIGLRSPHLREIAVRSPALDWLEIHSENYFGTSGPHWQALLALRERYPVSAHGVGLSLGSADGIAATHLAALVRLVERLEPVIVSEHLAWGGLAGWHGNDLLPLPCTREALACVVTAIDRAQCALRRPLLIENVSAYIAYDEAEMSEPEMLGALAAASGCGILLDLNNIDVSARNLGLDAHAYIDALPRRGVVQQLHLAGHALETHGERVLAIDTHDRAVSARGWALLRHALRRFGPVPVLIEWDAQLPALDVLLDEAATAAHVMAERDAHAA